MNAPRGQGRRRAGSPRGLAPESSALRTPGLRGAALGLEPLPAGPEPSPQRSPGPAAAQR